MAGLYIHIPFCKSRCIYCGFYSTTLIGLKENYVSAICHEMELRRNYIDQPIETIYFGGGTPSLLSIKEIEHILTFIYNTFEVKIDSEISLECNPDDITPQFARDLKAIGINRISMGVQTFSDKRLQFLKRRHDSKQTFLSVNMLKDAGINNISIDLIFGFPKETLNEWKYDLDCTLSLDIKHISAYCLTYEENTILYRMLKRQQIKEIEEDDYLKMYNLLINVLQSKGFEHYEISNFAKQGFRSQHNSSYWRQLPYIGIGAAAHSYNIISRQWNISDVKQYIDSINHDSVPFEIEVLDERTQYNDLITTALRTIEGLDLEFIKSNYGSCFYKYCIQQANKYINQNLLIISNNSFLKFTREGIFVSDMIMSDLIKI